MYRIYKITNIVNNNIYIGITKKSLNRRLSDHINSSKRSKTLLYEQMLKYGYENFIIEEIDNCLSKDEAIDKEKYYIELYKTNKFKYPNLNGMNMNDGGILPPNNKGKKLFNFLKLRNRKLSESTKKKISNSLKIYHNNLTDDEKRKRSKNISKSLIGKNKSLDHKTKLSLNRKGKKMTEDTKEKISKKLLGRKISDTTKRKISLIRSFFSTQRRTSSNKEKNLSYINEEYRKKLSNALKNRKISDNHRKKLSESLKGVNYKNSKIRIKNIENNNTIYFNTLKEVSEYMNLSASKISRIIRKNKIYKNIIIERIFND